jgi:phosphoglycolate phosphatase
MPGSARFDLLILDFDGTLADSEALLVGLVNDVVQAHGFAPADARLVGNSIGLPLDTVLRRAAPSAGDVEIEGLSITYRKRARMAEFICRFRLYPGVVETLGRLRAAGVRLVIGTSKSRPTTLEVLRHCAIDEVIDDVVGGDSVTRGKPHPEMVYQARALFPVPAERTLMVGDTSFDIDMGHAAGVATCAVTYGMQDAGALRQLRPTFVIDRIEALADIVLCEPEGL